jgi:protein TonB
MALVYYSKPLRHDPLAFAVILAASIHLILIMGIGIDIDRDAPAPPDRTLDVTIVQPQQKPQIPEEADFLANASQQGATEIEGDSPPTAPPVLPTPSKQQIATQELVRSGSTLAEPKPSQRIVTSNKNPVKQDTQQQKQPVQTRKKTDIAQLLASTRNEISRLTLEMDENTRSAANRPRRKAISASTQEYIYASYLTTWRKKVERIGNLNYPDEAKRKKLYGNLLLHVAVQANGTVQTIRVVHSSGHKLLDDAAIRIVRLAAPFAPFPPEIRKQVDILDITRTWQFLNNNQLFSGN